MGAMAWSLEIVFCDALPFCSDQVGSGYGGVQTDLSSMSGYK
jgi:hypothetical protein